MPIPPPFRALALATALLTSAQAAPTSVQTYPFQAMGASASGATGRLSVRTLSPQQSASVLTLRGLIPNRAYVAHYHALGPAGGDACASQGPITLGFPAFKADARGQATVTLRADPARLRGNLGAYVNVHMASDLTDIPLCAAVLKVAAAHSRPAQPPVTAPQLTVKIGDNVFQPARLSVVAGTTVTWVHTGQVTHNVLSLQVTDLHSPDLRPGDQYSYTFKTPGTYTYYCSYHDGMSATITVTNR